jgi:hypothetical protein
LEQAVNPDHSDESWFTNARETLARLDQSWMLRNWRIVLTASIVIASIACILPGAIAFIKFSKISKTGFGSRWESKAVRERLLTLDQRLILYGDARGSSLAERYETLCEQFPDNPSYYADYAMHYANEHGEVPPNFLEVGKRIDPDNGWFPAFAAAVASKDSVKAFPRTAQEKKGRAPKRWEILDQSRLDQAMILLHESRRYTRFESYQDALATERLALLPKAQNFMSQTHRILYRPTIPTTLQWQHLGSAVAAQSERLKNSQDLQTFAELLEAWESTSQRILHDSEGLLPSLIGYASIVGTMSNLIDATNSFGMDRKAASMRSLDEDLRKYYNDLEAKSLEEPLALLENHGSSLSLTNLSNLRYALNTPPLTKSEARPGRLVEHSLRCQIIAVCVIPVLLLFSLIASLYRFRFGLAYRSISGRLTSLVTVADWSWLFVVGVLGPLAFYQITYFLTPLGGREWTYKFAEGRPHGLQHAAWILSSISCPIAVARWRLRKRLAGLDLEWPGQKLTSAALLIALFTIPLSGTAFLIAPTPLWLRATLICLGLVVIALLAIGLRATFGSGSKALGRLALSRTLAPIYLVSAFSMGLFSPLYRAQESYWMARDTLVGGELHGCRFQQIRTRRRHGPEGGGDGDFHEVAGVEIASGCSV